MDEWLHSGTTEGAALPMGLVRAAEYVRMSTEHQKYSTENQAKAIREYAEPRGIEIVRTYADEGKSGLRLDGRDALKRLIQDVESGDADFTTILVYDVSRWGRFQDADESAYYEYVCKREGISVQYCAEQFENDGSPVSTIVKGVKRAMAGEYSRELSAKVFAGQCHLIEMGFRQGGPPGFGLRRRLVDQNGAAKGDLAGGEQKSIQTDRVILVPGPPEEVENVRWIYESFVNGGLAEQQIARILNTRGLFTDLGRPWTRGTIHQILINEKYIGSNVWNRISYKLKKKRVRNDPGMWIRVEGAFEPLVDRCLFAAAQAIIRARSCRITNEQMLEGLKGLFQERGYLSGLMIDETEHMPSSSTYRSRFGTLVRAYQSILQNVQKTKVIKAGYIPYPPFVMVDPNTRELSGFFIEVMDEIVSRMGPDMKIDYEETTWGTMVVGVQSGKFDVVVSGIFSTIPRSMQVTFSRPLLLVGLSAVARADDSRFQTEEDLQKDGLVVAVTAGEVGHTYAQQYLPKAKLIVMDTPDITRPMLEVMTGRADIGIADSMSVYNFVEAHKAKASNLFAERPLYLYGTGLMLPRDLQWKDFIDQSISFLEYSKVLERLENKYKKGTEWISLRRPY